MMICDICGEFFNITTDSNICATCKSKFTNPTESNSSGCSVKPEVMPLEELSEKADRVIELKQLMDKTFIGNFDAHLKLVIMAAISDAYIAGQKLIIEKA